LVKTKFSARHLAFCDFRKMCPYAPGGHVLAQEVVMRLVEGDDGDIRRIALVAGSGMRDVA
jgi:hypothetical protein